MNRNILRKLISISIQNVVFKILTRSYYHRTYLK